MTISYHNISQYIPDEYETYPYEMVIQNQKDEDDVYRI